MTQILHITDCHLFGEEHTLGYGDINPYETLQCVLSLAQHKQVDCILITGDVSADYSVNSYQLLKHLLDRFLPNIPIWMVPGNHDDIASMISVFPTNLLSVEQPIEFESWVLIGLNSKSDGAYGYVSLEQLNALSENANLNSHKHIVVAVHHHPIECGGWMDKHAWSNKKAFMQCISTIDNVRSVVYGHIHQDKVDKVGNCELIVSPSTCWQWANTTEFSHANLSAGFRCISLLDDGSMNHQVFRI